MFQNGKSFCLLKDFNPIQRNETTEKYISRKNDNFLILFKILDTKNVV